MYNPGNFIRVCVSVLVSSIKFPSSLSLRMFSSSFKVCSRHLILHQNDILQFLELSLLCLFLLLLPARSETKASILSGDDAFCGLCLRDDCILSYTAHLSSHSCELNLTRASANRLSTVITNCDSIDHLSPKHVNHTIRDYDQFLPQLRRLKQNKILYKNNLYMTCTQNWEVPVSYHSINVILTKRERTRENSISNTSWEIPLLKSFKKSTARSITKLWMQIMFV